MTQRHTGERVELTRDCELGLEGERAIVSRLDGHYMELTFYHRGENRELIIRTGADYQHLRPSPPIHSVSSAPPSGFTRYQIEIDVHDDIDSSALLESMQEMAEEMIPDERIEGGPLSETLVETIVDRVSVQRMEG